MIKEAKWLENRKRASFGFATKQWQTGFVVLRLYSKKGVSLLSIMKKEANIRKVTYGRLCTTICHH
jgi:hypothetical protein